MTAVKTSSKAFGHKVLRGGHRYADLDPLSRLKDMGSVYDSRQHGVPGTCRYMEALVGIAKRYDRDPFTWGVGGVIGGIVTLSVLFYLGPARPRGPSYKEGLSTLREWPEAVKVLGELGDGPSTYRELADRTNLDDESLESALEWLLDEEAVEAQRSRWELTARGELLQGLTAPGD